MSKYIEADALIEVLNDNGVPYNADANYFIEHAPTIDIVHCRECKRLGYVRYGSGICDVWGKRVRENFFCGFGEREGE